jgi:Arf-GAP/GTPase/ANK repeat/PH domain-containing protein 1/3
VFEASSCEERDEWVSAIEQQILNTLQGNESSKAKGGHSASSIDIQKMKSIKSDVAGNNKCVDCDAPNPDWASINLGVLICIECSGVHRNLGSHISRVRSLDLDEWPPGHLAVMTAIGNRTANSIWEHRINRPGIKPSPNSSQEEKERFIIAKYSRREFLMPLSNQAANMNNASHLVDAICRSDIKTVALALAHCNPDDVNASVSPRDARSPLHLASSLGNLAFVQLLIWSNANVKAIDHEGRTCVSYARTSGVTELVELLLTNGCPDITLSGTLPRRKNSLSSHRKNEVLEKVTSSVL